MFTRSIWNLSAPQSNSCKLFPDPRFTAFLLDSIAFLSSEAATRGMAGLGSCIIAKNRKQGPTAVAYIGTKGPLCQQRERVRGRGIDPQQRSSQRGHSATGNTDSAEMATPLFSTGIQFQSRFTGSLSNLPHTQLTVILLSL